MNSENFQALNVLQERYKNKIQCIYLDPPYNTGDGDFLYKDKYMHSSWLSLINDRLKACGGMVKEDGCCFVSIDDNEVSHLRILLDSVIGEECFLADIAYERSGSAGLGQGGKIVNTTEHILSYAKNKDYINDVQHSRPIEFKTMKRYNKILVREGEKELIDEFESKSNGQPIKIYKHTSFKTKTISLRKPKERFSEIKEEFSANFNALFRTNNVQKENQFQNSLISKMEKKYLYTVEYVPSRGKNKNKETTLYYLNKELFAWLKDSASLHGDKIIKENKITDCWAHADIPKADLANEGGVYLSRGKKPEQLMRRLISLGSNPNDIIIDFFLGSGSTASTAMKMGRYFLGIDGENYFRDKAVKRMKNVLNGESSGVSKISKWQGGGCFKYFYLESYEDTLNNLTVTKPSSKQQSILDANPELKEDYMLSYCLDVETNDSASLLNLEQFEDPFNYKLNIATSSVGVTKPTKVDLVETFNYLLGLTVKQIDTIRGFKVVIGQNPQEESVLVVWRVLAEKDNAALETFMAKQKYHPKDTEFDHIYVNGDHTLEDPHSKVKMTEIEFKRLMFDVQDV